jgi:hypothetical protein
VGKNGFLRLLPKKPSSLRMKNRWFLAKLKFRVFEGVETLFPKSFHEKDR